MAISIREQVLPILERAAVTGRANPERMRELLEDFRRQFGDRHFADVGGFFAFCGEISVWDRMPQDGTRERTIVEGVRREVLNSVIAHETTVHNTQQPPHLSTPRESMVELDRERGLRQPRSEARLRVELRQILILASWLGQAEFLRMCIATGMITEPERQRVITVLSDFTGPGEGGGMEPTICTLPDVVLQQGGVRDIARDILTCRIYADLMRQDVDDLQTSRRLVPILGQEARRVLDELCVDAGVTPGPALNSIFREVIGVFREASQYQPPASLIRELEICGRHPVPSLRQRLAVVMLRRMPQAYVIFETGDGKTNVVVQKYEEDKDIRRQKGLPPPKMLWVGPLETLQYHEVPFRFSSEQVRVHANRRVRGHCYYHDDARPTVGVLEGNTGDDDRLDAISQEIVFVPSTSMLLATIGERRVVDLLKEQGFTHLILDEAQDFNGEGEYFGAVLELSNGIPQLRENGQIILLSATPVSNDLRAFHRVVRQLLAGEGAFAQTNEPVNPEALRNDITRYLVKFDQPKPWQDCIDPVRYSLSPEQQREQARIINDGGDQMRKLNSLLLLCLNPSMGLNRPRVPSGLWNELTTLMELLFDESNSVLLVSNKLREGILDTRDEDNPVQVLFAQLVDHLRTHGARSSRPYLVETELIVGGNQARRPGILEQAERFYDAPGPEEGGGGAKFLVGAIRECVETGINLSDKFDAAVSIDPWFVLTKLQQLAGRFLREGRTIEDFRLYLCIGLGSATEAIFHHSLEHHGRVQRLLHRMPMTDQEIEQMQRETLDGRVVETNGSVRFGTHIVDRLRAPHEQREVRRQWMRDLGKYQIVSGRETEFRRYFLEQGGGSRVSNELRAFEAALTAMECEGLISGGVYADVHSQACGLHCLRTEMRRQTGSITSFDPHEWMRNDARARLERAGCPEAPSWRQATMNRVAQTLGERSQHAILCPEGFECTRDDAVRDPVSGYWRRNERIITLRNFNRALVDGGTLLLQIPWDACTAAEFEMFCHQLSLFSLTVLPEWTGDVTSAQSVAGDRFRSRMIAARKEGEIDEVRLRHRLNPEHLRFTFLADWSRRGAQGAERRVIEEERNQRCLPYSFLHHSFVRGDRTMECAHRPEVQAEQIAHLGRLRDAVAQLRELHARTPLTSLSPADLIELERRGIYRAEALSAQLRGPAFFLGDTEDDVRRRGFRINENNFRPLDAKWDQILHP